MISTFRILPLAAIAFAALLMAGAATASAQSAAQADNSAQNKDRSATADNQSNAKIDRITTARIRRAIIADKDLSMNAHNIKVITRNGTVTLRGPVESDVEKQKIETDVATVVSHDNIVDQLRVKQ